MSASLIRAYGIAQELEWPAWILALLAGVVLALVPLAWSVALTLGAILAVLIVLRPVLGLYLLILSVPFGSIGELRVGVMSVGVSEALVVLTIASWLARARVHRPARLHLGPLGLPLLLFLGVGLLTLPGALSLQYSVKELLKWLEVLGVYLLVSNALSARQVRAVVLISLLAGALAAVLGIYQFLFQVGPEHFVLLGRFMRAYGTFEQPNPYGGYLGLVWPLAAGLVVAGLRGARAGVGSRRVWRGMVLLALGAGGLCAVALIMTWSRGAWLGAAAAALAMGLALIVRWSGRLALAALLVVAVVGYGLTSIGQVVVPANIAERFTDLAPYLVGGSLDVRGVEVNDANYAVIERLAHWRAAADMWTDRPWLGVGIGNYEPAYPEYQVPGWDEPLGHAHNYYLNAGAEMGLLGLSAYLLLWGSALWLAWRQAVQGTGIRWAIGLGALGILAHLWVHQVFDNLFVHNVYVHLAVVVGLCARRELGPGEDT